MNLVAGQASQFDIVIQIGSFQPWTQAHQAALASALQVAPHVALVLTHSCSAPSARHPLSLTERIELLRLAIPADWRSRLFCYGLRDTLSPESAIATTIATILADLPACAAESPRIAVMAAPGSTALHWGSHTTLTYPDTHDSSALWRHAALAHQQPQLVDTGLPPAANHYLNEWLQTPTRSRLHEEWRVLEQDRHAWACAPWPVTKVTVDCVVECAGQVLLIRRGRAPGRDLYALPGGFIDTHETLLQSARRELSEETGLDLRRLAPQASAVFDAPERSQRGRVITHAYHFTLDLPAPPPTQAGDDAAQAFWHPIAQLQPLLAQMHDDHALILEHFGVISPPPILLPFSLD